MGATIEVRGAAAFIQGGARLQGDWVHATDIRAGVSLLIAGLMAEGTTCLTGVEHIERGYADAIQSFCQLGARITLKKMGNSTHVPSASIGL